jgi:AcrR family transcriptional regulator
LEAAKAVLAEQGFQAFGINAVARQAGCDKQLIYRYFDGQAGLLEAIGQDVAQWIGQTADTGAPMDETYPERLARFADAYLLALRGNRLIQKILLWELSAPPEEVKPLVEARGKAMFLWMKQARGDALPPPGVDYALINASVVAIIHQMVLSSAVSGGFSGLPLQTDADWQRLRDGIRAMIGRLYSA